MTLTQDRLRREVARRIRRSRPDLAARLDLSGTAGLLAAQAALAPADPPPGPGTATGAAAGDAAEGAAGDAAGGGPADPGGAAGTVAVAVVSRFDLAGWIPASCGFALGLDPGQRADWRRSFTRTVFLAGNPANLTDRFDLRQLAADGSVGWLGPAAAGGFTALRRLLTLFAGPDDLPAPPALRVEVPAAPGRPARRSPVHRPPVHRPPVHRELYLATAGVSVLDCMVNLNHLLAEAVLDGLLAPADTLLVRPVPRLVGMPEPVAALRIGLDRGDPDRLRAYAGLTKEIPDA